VATSVQNFFEVALAVLEILEGEYKFKMGHISGTVCRTYYDQPVHQMWNLHIHPIRRHKRQQKCRNWGDLGLPKVIGNI